MADAGILLFMYDAHSFGRSDPRDPGHRSFVQKWEHLVDDVYTFREAVVDPLLQAQSKLPLFLAGLSMGGMTTVLAGLRAQHAWQGLILLSPAVDCPRNFTLTILSTIQSILVRLVPRARLVPQPVIPNVTLNEKERENLAKDEFFDPLKIRTQTGAMFLHGWNYIAKHEHELTLPILIHYSSIDKIVYPKATERFAKHVASKDITIKPFNFAHDIFLDTCKEESSELIIKWIFEHSPDGPAALESVSNQLNETEAAERPAKL